MKMLAVLIALFRLSFALLLSIGLQVVVLMYGWGLQARSWGWIIGIGLCTSLIAMINQVGYETRIEKLEAIVGKQEEMSAASGAPGLLP